MTPESLALLQAQLVRHEGYRQHPYTDSVGVLTIGIGRNLTDKGLSDDEIMHLFNNDIADAIDDARHLCLKYDELSQARRLVLISMVFNLGRSKLAKFDKFLGALHREEWNEAANEILDSDAARKDAPARYATLARMMREDSTEWV